MITVICWAYQFQRAGRMTFCLFAKWKREIFSSSKEMQCLLKTCAAQSFTLLTLLMSLLALNCSDEGTCWIYPFLYPFYRLFHLLKIFGDYFKSFFFCHCYFFFPFDGTMTALLLDACSVRTPCMSSGSGEQDYCYFLSPSKLLFWL